MATRSARQAALTALRQWRTRKEFADSIIAKILGQTKLAASDRAFALDLFYGVLRNLTLLDFWIGCLRSSSIDVDLRDIVRLGLYQLLLAETPEHAAVYETVELAPKSRSGVVNGILRNASRRRQELLENASNRPLEIRTSHPKFLVTRWERNFGAENTEALCLWNNRPPPIYARINSLKISRAEFLRKYPDARPLTRYPEFVELEFFVREALTRGHCYVQDPSAALACRLVDPTPGEKILDACAAPGGKTSYLATLMQNTGLIVACDRDAERIGLLKENMARLGTTIVNPVTCDWIHSDVPASIVDLAPFDRILVDAPCSNTGVMRRRVDVRWRLSPKDFIRMPEQQLSILRAVTPFLKKGGTLVYSTCSLEPEENGQIVEQLARSVAELSIKEQKDVLPFRDNLDGAFAVQLTKN